MIGPVDRRSRWLAGVPAFLCLVAGALNAPQADEPLVHGSLSGRVVDPAGKPVAGARVSLEKPEFDDATLTSSSRILAETTTDAQGHFQLDRLAAVYRPKPRYELRVEAEGYAPQCATNDDFSIFPGAIRDVQEIQVAPGCIVSGLVVDSDGTPRAGATVGCEVKQGGPTVAAPINRLQTVVADAQGRFRTPPLAIGKLVLSVHEPERQLAARRLPIGPPGEQALAEPIQLENDLPIPGVVVDEGRQPLPDVVVWTTGERRAVSDAEGRFTLRGWGPNPHFQVVFAKEGYLLEGWGVVATPEGFRATRSPDGEVLNMEKLVLPLRRAAWIEGHAIDADTNQPVKLDKIVLCTFERKPNGEILVGKCAAAKFEQPTAGHFRVPYARPDEYHLALSAAGYHDAEAFTLPVKELQPISGLLVKLTKNAQGTKPQIQKQLIVGSVSRGGKPVDSGWVGLWVVPRPSGLVHVMRARAAAAPPGVFSSAPIRRGAYTLEAPFQHATWYVVVEEPGQAITQVGPFDVKANERKNVDIACVEGGGIRGRVNRVPAGWQGQLWVVAFSAKSIRAEARVQADGNFAFDRLPPGEYGLKVGHDAYQDTEVPQFVSRDDVREKIIDPFKRAVKVTVESNRVAEGVELELPR